MQSHPAANKPPDKSRLIRPAHPESGWTYSRLTGLLFAALALLVVGAAVLYLTWDYMPDRVQYIPRYLQATFRPSRPHTEFVPTPVAAAAPEDTLARIRLASPAEEVAPVEAAPPPAQAEAEAAPAPAVEEPVAPAPEPAPAYALPGPSAQLSGIRHEYQGWNNCGPATLGMQLSYFGRPDMQAQTAPFLKPDPDDKNVNPTELVAYAHSIGYGGQVVVGGDLTLLRTLLANGLPVIVESWFIPDPDDEMGHYLLLTGYDGETLSFYDSYHGPNVQEQAAEFDALWRVFNRTAIVVWPPEKEPLASAILGKLTDPQAMAENALAQAHAEVNANPQDKFGWFNLGTNLLETGDIANATKAFDTARSLGLPWRMLWYQFGPYAAYYASGQYEEVIGLADVTLNSAGNLEESFYWRARAEAALGQSDAARRDLQQALKLNPNFVAAQEALDALP